MPMRKVTEQLNECRENLVGAEQFSVFETKGTCVRIMNPPATIAFAQQTLRTSHASYRRFLATDLVQAAAPWSAVGT